MAEVTTLSIALALGFLLAWDAWRRYLAAVDRTVGLKKLEASIAERLAKLERTQSEHTRAIGVRAMAQARMASE